MKKTQKIFALLIAMIMVFGMCNTVFAAQTEDTTASITITTDDSYEGTDQEYTYKAYKVFDASYDSLTGTWTQDNKDANADIAYTPTDAKVAYFMKNGNPWITTIQGLTTYFTVTQSANKDGYVVVPKDDFTTTAQAKTLAAALKNALPASLTGDYEGIAITANGTAVNVQPGYYLIVGDTAANLALVTTNVTIVEKNEYPHILKEYTTETTVGDFDADDDTATSQDASAQVGDTISYTLTVTIPTGANQAMVVTDTFTSGLSPVLDGTAVKTTITGLTDATPVVSAPADGKFTVSLTAAEVTANAGKTFTIVYEAVVTEDAWYQTEVNTGTVKYGNDYESTTDRIETVRYNVEIDKKAESEDGDSLKGAKFELYRTDADHSLTKAAVSLVALTDEELTAAGITKDADTVYYRVADNDDATTTTTIDMTDAVASVIYGLDGDSTYYAREIKAPTGYNILSEDVEVVMNDQNHVQPVVNKAGSVLPSTGGIGTTIFYIVGAVLVIGAGVVLVARRRMTEN